MALPNSEQPHTPFWCAEPHPHAHPFSKCAEGPHAHPHPHSYNNLQKPTKLEVVQYTTPTMNNLMLRNQPITGNNATIIKLEKNHTKFM